MDMKIQDMTSFLSLVKGKYIADLIMSALLGLVVTLQRLIDFTGDVYQKLLPDTFRSFRFSDIFVFFLATICFYLFILLIRIVCGRIHVVSEKDETTEMPFKMKLILWGVFTVAVAMWSFFYLSMSYPGSVLEDSMSSLEQSMEYMGYSNHHPIAFTFFVKFFLQLGLKINNNVSFGIAVVSCAQILIVAGIQGYFLLWLKLKHVKNIFIVLVYLFYVHNALLPTYAFTMWKDPLFSVFLFAYVLHLYDIFSTKGEILGNRFFAVRYFIFMFLVAFFRNNAIYVVLATTVIVFICYKKRFLFSALNLVVVALCLFIQNPVYHHYGLTTYAQEKIGIPMQQIAYVLATEGEVASGENIDSGDIYGEITYCELLDVEVIEAMLPIDEWRQSYTPFIADSIKWNDQFDTPYINENLSLFVKAWWHNLPHHLGDYVKAYMMETYGFWSLGTQDDYCYCQNEITENLFDLTQRDLLYRFTGLDLSWLKERTGRFCNGTLFWTMVLTMFFVMKSSKKNLAMCLLPMLLTWGTFMIATPVAFSLRYMLAFVYALPFFLYMIWEACSGKDVENEQEM